MSSLILGSSSPRRLELLTITGLPFTVARPDIDETPLLGESPADYVLRLSLEKARAIAITAPAGTVILSADTTVVDDGQILGKPDNPEHATAMLRQLRDHAHVVHTGVTVLSGERALTRVTTTSVIMRPYTDEEIAAFVTSGDAMGKAGSYAIQHPTFRPVGRIEGCYTNVVGLPLCTVSAMLAEFGLRLDKAIMCSPLNPPCVFRPPGIEG